MIKAQFISAYTLGLIDVNKMDIKDSKCCECKFSIIDADSAMRCRMKDLKIVDRDGLCVMFVNKIGVTCEA